MLAGMQVPEMNLVAVLPGEKNFRNEAVFDHVGRAPFARNEHVVTEMPPRIVGELLRPAIDLPLSANVEAFVVHEKDAARGFALGVAQRRDVKSLRSTVDGVRPRV